MPTRACVRHRPELLQRLFSIRLGALGLTAPLEDGSQPSGWSPLGNVFLQRLGRVGKGLAFCGVRDGRSIARLLVFAERPAEAAVAQKIGFNRDRERVIFDHPDIMGA